MLEVCAVIASQCSRITKYSNAVSSLRLNSRRSGSPGKLETNIVPLNVGSFDSNFGLRFKYFLHCRAYIGLTAKYHVIHYNNDGGTDLSGNAYTLDLLFGSN